MRNPILSRREFLALTLVSAGLSACTKVSPIVGDNEHLPWFKVDAEHKWSDEELQKRSEELKIEALEKDKKYKYTEEELDAKNPKWTNPHDRMLRDENGNVVVRDGFRMIEGYYTPPTQNGDVFVFFYEQPLTKEQVVDDAFNRRLSGYVTLENAHVKSAELREARQRKAQYRREKNEKDLDFMLKDKALEDHLDEVQKAQAAREKAPKSLGIPARKAVP